MLDLLLTILAFNLLIVIFKFFARFNIDNLQALIVNYLVAGFLGLYFSESFPSLEKIMQMPWFYHAILIGFLFVTTFNVFAYGTQNIGIAVTTITNKLSLLIPVGYAIIFYPDEKLTILKSLGVLIAAVAICLSLTDGRKISFHRKYLWLLLFLFIGQGIADTIFNNAQRTAVNMDDKETFFTVLFFMASSCGIILLLMKSLKRPIIIASKNIFGGIILGIPNYASILFFFNALEKSTFEASQVFPIISIGLIIISALTGLLFFNEKLKAINWLGLILSTCAIFLISFF